MRVMLTGATGDIGRVVLKIFVDAGWQLRVLARPGTEESVPKHQRVEMVTGTLDDRALLERSARGAHVVVHMAGLLPGEPPDALAEVNVGGTARVAEACVRSGVGRLVFVSSTSVYRDAANPLARGLDEHAPLLTQAANDVEEYGLSKIEAERLIFQAQRIGRVPFVIIRAPVVYGIEDGWETRLIRAARVRPLSTLARLPAIPSLQCVHVHDLALGIVRVATHRAAANQVFNMAGTELFSFRDVGRMAFNASARGLAAPPLNSAAPLKYQIRKAQSMLGFKPMRTLLSTADAY